MVFDPAAAAAAVRLRKPGTCRPHDMTAPDANDAFKKSRRVVSMIGSLLASVAA